MEDAWVFFDALVRVETRLYNALDTVLRERHGVVTSQLEFLQYIARHEGARVGDLAATFAVGVGATSKAVDRLERAGLVERRPHPSDRRSSVLVLSAAGERLLADARATATAALEDLLGPADLMASTALLQALRSRLEQAGAGTPTG